MTSSLAVFVAAIQLKNASDKIIFENQKTENMEMKDIFTQISV